jgi:hypothetical protein
MCMVESPQMTFAAGYKPTVNESETIKAAQPAGGFGGLTRWIPAAPARALERS